MYGQPRSLGDAYSQLEKISLLVAKHQTSLGRSYQISEGTVIKVSDDRMTYEVALNIEKLKIKDVVLLLDKAYYQIIGFPNVGDFVKVFHKDAFSTAFIIARVNDQQGGIVMNTNSCIPLGSNIA